MLMFINAFGQQHAGKLTKKNCEVFWLVKSTVKILLENTCKSNTFSSHLHLQVAHLRLKLINIGKLQC